MNETEIIDSQNKSSEKKSRKKRLVLLLALLAAIAGIILFFIFMNNRITAIEIRIQRLVGEVNLFDEKGKDLSLMEKMRLNSGQSLKTAEESLVMMSLDNTKLMTLEESSRAKIKASGKELEFQLAEGNLFFNINEKIKEDESFDIRTSTMLCGIRGTSGYTGRDDGDHETLMVTDGVVEVTGENPVTKERIHTFVYAGQQIIIYLDDEAEGDATISFICRSFREEDLPALALNAIHKDPALGKRIAKATGFSTTKLNALAEVTSVEGRTMYGRTADEFSQTGIRDSLPVMGQRERDLVTAANRAVDTAGRNLPLEIAIIKGLRGVRDTGADAGCDRTEVRALLLDSADCINSAVSKARDAGVSEDDLIAVAEAVSGTLSSTVDEMKGADLTQEEVTMVVAAISTVYTNAIDAAASQGGNGSEALVRAVADASTYAKDTVQQEMQAAADGEETVVALLGSFADDILSGSGGNRQTGLADAGQMKTPAGQNGTATPNGNTATNTTMANAGAGNNTARNNGATGGANTTNAATAAMAVGFKTGGGNGSGSIVSNSAGGGNNEQSQSGSGSGSGEGDGGSENNNNGGSSSGTNNTPSVTRYAVTATAGEGGTVTASATSAAEGEQITLTATPDATHDFAGWTDSQGNAGIGAVLTNPSITLTMPAAAVSVSASFVEKNAPKHTVSFPASFTNGNVTISGASTNASGAYEAAAGVIISLTAAPDTGYELDSLSVTSSGAAVTTTGSGTTRSFTMPADAISISAQFRACSYTVTLEKDGGTVNAGDVTSYTYGVGATLPTNVTKAATDQYTYRFDGWYTSATGGSRITAIGTTETGAKTFYAHWTPVVRSYSVATSAGSHGALSVSVGGSAATEAAVGSIVTVTITPDNGYELDSFSVGGAGGTVSATGTGNTRTFAMPTYAVTASASFKASIYTVSLSPNSGNALPGGNNLTYTYGVGLTLPTNVTKDSTAEYNYTFAGWFTEASGGSQVTAISSTDYGDKFYYAHWNMSARTYSINYVTEGGTINNASYPRTYTYDTHTTTTLPTNVTRTGTPQYTYTFDGWYIAATGGSRITSFSNNTTGAKTYYAHWTVTIIDYGITVSAGTGGSVAASANGSTVTRTTAGSTVTLIVTPDTGYALDTISVSGASGAVTLSGTGNTRTFTMPEEDVTVSAAFTQLTYTVTQSSTTEGSVTSDKSSAHYGETVTLTIAAGTGYELQTLTVTGASGAVSLSGSGDTRTFSMPAENVTVNATFRARNWTVSLNTAGGTINSGNVTSYTYGVGATLPTDVTKAPTDTETYGFAGWYTEETGGSRVESIGTSETGTKQFWAHWTATARSYGITYVTDGGTINAGNVTSYTCGVGATLPTDVTKTQTAEFTYAFDGWFTEATGGSHVTAISTTDTGAKTFYAHWTASRREYTITPDIRESGTISIHLEGQTGAITSAPNGATVVIDNITPGTNYRLKEMFVTEAGQIVHLATWTAGSTSLSFTMPTKGVTVRAVFELNTYGITVNNYSGGSYSVSSSTSGPFSTSPARAVVGETVTVTMTRQTGRGKNTLSVAEQSVVMNLSNDDSTYTYQFTMPSNAVRIDMGSADMSASFSITPAATVTNGTVALNSERLPDRTIELTVTPSTGYELDTLTVTKVMPSNVQVGTGYSTTVPTTLKSGTNNVYTFSMPPMDVTYSATFKNATYAITYETGGGTIQDATYATSYVYGTGTSSLPENVTKTQTAEYIYGFAGWFTAATGGTQVTAISTTDTGAKTLYAHYTETRRSYSVTKSTTTNGSIAVKVGNTEVTSAANGATVTVTPTPATGYEIDTLTYTPAGGSATAITATNGVYSFVMPTSNVTVTATFRAASTSSGIYWSINNAGTVLSFYNTAGIGRTAVAADADLYGGAPWEMNNVGDDITTIVFEDVIRPTSLRGWFQCLRNLTTFVNMQNLDTSNVTTMYKMFFMDDSLTELDLSYFDTSNVTDMDWMFESCEYLETIYASDSFVTSGLSDLDNGMFYNCENIIGGAGSSSYSCGNSAERAHIDGGTNNPGYFTRKNSTSSGTTATMLINSTNSNNAGFRAMMDSVYNGDTLKILVKTFSKSATAPSSSQDDYNVASNDSDRPVYLWYEPSTQALKWYSEAETVYLESNISLMFSYYQYEDETILEAVDFTGLNMSRVTNICNLFEGCLRLTSVTWGGGDRASIEYASNVFSSNAITEIDLSPFTFENCALFDGMFWACDNLEKIYVDNGVRINSNPSTSDNMFWGCDSLVGGNHTEYDENQTNVEYARVDAAGTPGYFTLRGTGNPTTATIDLTRWNNSGLFSNVRSFARANSYTSGGVEIQTTASEKEIYLFRSGTSLKWYSEADTVYLPATTDMFSDLGDIVSVNLTGLDASHTTDMSSLFEDCTSLTVVTWGDIDTSNVTSMTNMFYGCSSLTNFSLNGFDLSSLTSMQNMFTGCSSLETLNLSVSNTDSISDMYNMFSGCGSLISLDLSSFTFAGMTNSYYFGEMFTDCVNLERIYVASGTDWSSIDPDGYDAFQCASVLTGGKGTSLSIIDSVYGSYERSCYGRIDSAVWTENYDGSYTLESGTPGYFTLIGSTPSSINYQVLVNPTNTDSVSASVTKAHVGDSVTVTITPADADHTLKRLSVQRASGSAVAVSYNNGTYSFTMPASAVRISAEFIETSGVGTATGTDSSAWFTDKDMVRITSAMNLDTLTVPADKTLEIASGVAVTVSNSVTIGSGVVVNNYGTFTNNGTMTNNGTFNNYSGNTLNNYGTIINNGTLVNGDGGDHDGRLNNHDGAVIENNGTIINNAGSVVNNDGEIEGNGIQGAGVVNGDPAEGDAEGTANGASEDTASHAVRLAEDLDGGTVRIEAAGVTDLSAVPAGTTVTLTPVPEEGHISTLDSVSATDADGTQLLLTYDVESGTYTFAMPASDVTVTAVFTDKEATGDPASDEEEEPETPAAGSSSPQEDDNETPAADPQGAPAEGGEENDESDAGNPDNGGSGTPADMIPGTPPSQEEEYPSGGGE